MRTRSSSNLIVESFIISKRRNHKRSKQIVEPELRTIVETPVANMADTHTMSELLQAPTEGYGDAILILAILVENFELKVRFDEMFYEAWDRFKDLLRKCPHHDFSELHQIDTFYNALTQSDQDSLNAAANQQASVKAIEETCVTYGGPHPYYECLATGGKNFDACAAVGPYNQGASPIGDLKAITTRSGVAYDGPTIPPTPSSLPKEVKREIEATKDNVQDTSSESTAHVQPLVVQVPISEPEVALKPNPKPSIPYPSRLNEQKLREKANNQALKFFQIFQRLHFDIRFVDAILHMPNEEYAQEVLGFLDSSTSGNPTPSDPIIASFFSSLTPFKGSDFILEEIETFLRTPDELSILDDDFDPEGDIALNEKLLNEDPSSNLPPMKNEDLKQANVSMINHSIEEPPKLELKDLPSHLEYAFLEGTDKLPVIISKELKDDEQAALLNVLKSHKWAIAWKISDIKGVDPCFCNYKILMEDDFKQAVQHQRRVNPKIHEVIKKEVIKLFDSGLIYPISDSPWVSPVHCVPKKGGMTVVENEDNELLPTRLVMGWRVCIDYHKLNDATRKDHFPLPFLDQMHKRLAKNEYYCFLDGFLGYFQILIYLQDQEKTTFTFPYGTFAYRRMPFGLCNAPGMFQICMMAIFHDMIEETMEVFIDDLSIFEDSFSSCLSHLDKMLKRIEVDRGKVDVIAKLPHPISVKGAENLAADHLSRLENPHEGDIEKKEINETFPLEILGMISFHGDSSTPMDEMPQNAIQVYEIFDVRGIDFIGSFPSSRGNKYILVVVDYLSKWVGAKALPTNDARVVVKFLKSLFALFGTPHAIISDCGENRASWFDKLDDALWAFRIAFKTPIRCTPYKLMYRKACHLPIKLEHEAYWALKHCNFDLKTAGDHRKVQMNELNELRDQAYENSLIYKEKTKKIHDSKINNRVFNVGD
uniref:Reverse transcriptase domain-containing protein n=1 Tax=Tanacetum cinerariifolium TaxID=118510 RepID=A0A6L2KFM6_TANCI|nr:reverse transcriptase domain-containing protein [Tanacetum cinerariifolium]